MVELTVDIAFHIVAVDHYLEVIPPAGLRAEVHLAVLRFRAVAAHFDGVPRVAPSADIPPGVVLVVLIVEDDEESLVTAVFPRAYIIYKLSGIETGIADTQTGVPVGRLAIAAGDNGPRTAAGIHSSILGEVFADNHLRTVSCDGGHREVVIGGLCVPGSQPHAVGGGREVKSIVGLRPQQVLVAQVVGHHLLHVVARRDEVGSGIEVDHVVGPAGVLLMGEDGCKGTHAADIAIFLLTQHIDSLAEGGIEVAVATPVAAVGGKLAVVDTDVAGVVVVFIVVVAHPAAGAVVVLINQLHRIVVAPRGGVGTPGLDVADGNDVGIFLLDSLVEHVVALRVLVALVAIVVHVEVVVLVAYLYELQVVGCHVAVLDALRAPVGRAVAVGIFYGVEGVLHQGVEVFHGNVESVSQSHVDHKHRRGAHVLGQLQVFVEA